jgi:hypothetical protein
MMWYAVPLVALLLAAPMTHGHQCETCKDVAKGYTPGLSFHQGRQNKCYNKACFQFFCRVVFDFDVDNLSFENCGQWNERDSERAPWRIAVGRTDGATCFGILLSDYDFITCEFKKPSTKQVSLYLLLIKFKVCS